MTIRQHTSIVALAELFAVMMLITLVACGRGSLTEIRPSDFPPGLAGTVTNTVTKARVSGATIQVQGKAVVTDSSGYYTIGNLQAGTFTVKVTHPDYSDAQRDVAISAFLSPGDFALQPKP
jgi:hypothetical protein